MSITVLNYLDQELVNNITQQASLRASTASASTESADFAASLSESAKALAADNDSTDTQASTNSDTTTVSSTTASSQEDYETYFKEASDTYGVSTAILKAIAKAESNFNPSAVSSAGAIGIMQLMPSTAASLGVSDAYDARENIMGGAKYISQLLSRYQGNLSLALAAYNAGSNNVDKYGGIPPFTETQNYVQKVLSYVNSAFSSNSSSSSASSTASGIFGLTGEERETANEMLDNFFESKNITKASLDMLVTLLKLKNQVSSLTNTNSTSENTTSDSADSDSSVILESSTGDAITAPSM